jgi:hypothetical protein
LFGAPEHKWSKPATRHPNKMTSPEILQWFAWSVTLAPELAREQLRGIETTPALGPGELVEALDVDLSYDVPHPGWGGRVARLVDAPGRRIQGVCRRVPSEDVEAVARLEAALGLATEWRRVRVRTGAGGMLEAVAFSPPATGLTTDGLVSESFLTTLALTAEKAGLPAEYVQRLQAEAQIVSTVQRAHATRLR